MDEGQEWMCDQLNGKLLAGLFCRRDMVEPAASKYDCPECGSTDTYVRPTSDMFECGDCRYSSPVEEVVEYWDSR